LRYSPFLSKPAARPIRFGNERLQKETDETLDSDEQYLLKRPPIKGIFNKTLNKNNVNPCAVSGGKRKRTGLIKSL
jgi:hypothetical protein